MINILKLAVFIFILSSCDEKLNTENTNNTETKKSIQSPQDNLIGKEQKFDTLSSIKKKENRPQIVRVEPTPHPEPDPYPEPYPYPEPPDPIPYPVPVPLPVDDQEPEVLSFADKMPDYRGGSEKILEFIKSNIRYPENCKEAGIEGNIYIRMVITPEGKATDFVILKSVPDGKELDREALRVVKLLTDWIPGEQNGKKVSVYYILPVRFRLN